MECVPQIGDNLRCYRDVHKPCTSARVAHHRPDAAGSTFLQANIVEGVSDGTVSIEMCIKLIGVARGSVMELREDYADFLRQHKCEIWSKDDSRTLATRNYSRTHYDAREYVDKCEARSNETVANIMLTLIRQMEAMLAKVLKALEAQFLEDGGLKEAMSRERRKRRGY